ncbi:mitochondrial ketone body formation hydroxymethylglutaryl-CoA synthase [Andalucia godoyi]|uniref:Hydroxymethylglutaryl-CoA synthase n=1 Tax=Andalucia godoyi TaxID=505711 RepID=A0A8K0F2I8_ANDGO|nr:mitochondrial ketone body formation hydroxymethylglutaryl-CoA synthase [Andalucia godoyi]|eukprot:ANDGO_01930.mRNA.1 mitochondrial ketone body formation hydroxymethylglutaryl-CoA synthase
MTQGFRPQNVGIHALEFYFPSQYVSQSELEAHDQASSGKYTIGLGQLNMAFVTDREDVHSICLTAVHSLLEKYSIDPLSIGRIEVGTETIVDKSKSVKSELMRIFAAVGNTNVEGVDCTNACYGGTASLFNSVAWVESSAWDGRFALCVAGDIAVYAEGNARPTGGCGAVAMLIGPDAPVVLESANRFSHMEHTYDFYKPNLSSEYPTVDGKMSLGCYLRALDHCYRGFREKCAKSGDDTATSLEKFAYACFHSPFNKQVQKSVGRLLYNDFLRSPHDKQWDDMPEDLRNVPEEESYTHRDIEQYFSKKAVPYYKRIVQPSVLLSQQLGNTYTASLYSALVSLITNVDPADLRGKRVVLFSYGSGLCSSMFSVRFRDSEDAVGKVTDMRIRLDIASRLAARHKVDPVEYNGILKSKELKYGKPNTAPSGPTDTLFPGTYYLTSIDDMWRRSYERKQK